MASLLQVLRLSAATQTLPKSSVCNVHGVNPQFLSIGKRFAEVNGNEPKFLKGAYYLGKMIWGKGYRELVDLLAQNKEDLGNIKMDIFGSGEDSDAVRAEVEKYGLALKFHAGRDHADAALHGYDPLYLNNRNLCSPEPSFFYAQIKLN